MSMPSWQFQAEQIRKQAEQLAAQHAEDESIPPPDRLPEVLHEMRVHQIQLEMQNELLRESQCELEQSRDQLAQLYDFAPVGYLCVDTSGIIRRMNLTTSSMLGVARGGPVVHRLASFAANGQRRVLDACIDHCRNAEIGEELVLEVTLQTRDGRELPALVRTTVVKDAQTEERRGHIALIDISQQKQAEAKLAQLNATLEETVRKRTAVSRNRARQLRRLATQLTQAEHNERKRLARLLHDDLQQVLLAAKMQLRQLASDQDDASLQDDLAMITDWIDQCVTLSRDLTQELSPAILQFGTLSDVLRWTADWFAEKYQLRVEVAIRLPPELDVEPPEHVRVFLFQAVRELLLNVVKHAEVREANVIVELSGERLMIDVQDDGVGFDATKLRECLEEPNGFGLFSIRERLRALGGHLDIQSEVGRGARLRLRVPIQTRRQDDLANPPPRAGAEVRNQQRCQGVPIRILVVDDHKIVREGLASILAEQADFEVVGQADDGEQAVAKSTETRPDVVVMDVCMPGLNGIEATRRIKQQHPEMAVIGLSFQEEASTAEAMIKAGATAFLNKDGPAELLFDAIRRLDER